MSITAIRSIATSALLASQVQMRVAASNIANADTEGYTRKTATQIATVTGSQNSGTSIAEISSTVDKFLLRDLIASTSDLASAKTLADFTDRLQSMFGTVSTNKQPSTSLADSLMAIESALIALANTPESSTLATTALTTISTLVGQLRETSNGVQGLRADADQQISDGIDTINEALETIDSLNETIIIAKARGDSIADLEDERNQALKTLAGLIDVSYSVSSNGRMQIATTSGIALVDSTVHTLNYTPASDVNANTVFGAITIEGTDVTSGLTNGAIGTLLTLRDDILPDVQDELDALASTLISAFNEVYNAGTPLPAPDSLTGHTAVDASDAFSATGTARIALIDDDGNLLSYADFDLSAYATVGDLVSAIDAVTGLDASITDGVLSIASSNGVGLAITGIDAKIGSEKTDFSAYFGLNDLLTGTGASDIRISDSVTTAGLSTAMLSTAATLTVGDQVVSHSVEFVQDLVSVLSDSQSFAAVGGLSATSTSLADYAANIVGDVSTRASTAATSLLSTKSTYETLSDAFSSQTGVNIDEETARVTELQQMYSASAQLYEVLNELFDALMRAARSAG